MDAGRLLEAGGARIMVQWLLWRQHPAFEALDWRTVAALSSSKDHGYHCVRHSMVAHGNGVHAGCLAPSNARAHGAAFRTALGA